MRALLKSISSQLESSHFVCHRTALPAGQNLCIDWQPLAEPWEEGSQPCSREEVQVPALVSHMNKPREHQHAVRLLSTRHPAKLLTLTPGARARSAAPDQAQIRSEPCAGDKVQVPALTKEENPKSTCLPALYCPTSGTAHNLTLTPQHPSEGTWARLPPSCGKSFKGKGAYKIQSKLLIPPSTTVGTLARVH